MPSAYPPPLVATPSRTGARSLGAVTTDGVRRDRWRDGGLDRVPVPGSPGELWLCGKHAVGADPEAALARIGAAPDARTAADGGPVGTIVCLNQRGELEDRYPAYVAWLQEHVGGRALWFPIPDLHAPRSTPAPAAGESARASPPAATCSSTAAPGSAAPARWPCAC